MRRVTLLISMVCLLWAQAEGQGTPTQGNVLIETTVRPAPSALRLLGYGTSGAAELVDPATLATPTPGLPQVLAQSNITTFPVTLGGLTVNKTSSGIGLSIYDTDPSTSSKVMLQIQRTAGGSPYFLIKQSSLGTELFTTYGSGPNRFDLSTVEANNPWISMRQSDGLYLPRLNTNSVNALLALDATGKVYLSDPLEVPKELRFDGWASSTLATVDYNALAHYGWSRDVATVGSTNSPDANRYFYVQQIGSPHYGSNQQFATASDGSGIYWRYRDGFSAWSSWRRLWTSADVIPGDNLGNHIASQKIILGAHSIGSTTDVNDYLAIAPTVNGLRYQKPYNASNGVVARFFNGTYLAGIEAGIGGAKFYESSHAFHIITSNSSARIELGALGTQWHNFTRKGITMPHTLNVDQGEIGRDSVAQRLIYRLGATQESVAALSDLAKQNISVVQTASFTNSFNSTLTEDATLKLTLPEADTWYQVEATIYYAAGSGIDWKYTIDNAAGASTSLIRWNQDQDANTVDFRNPGAVVTVSTGGTTVRTARFSATVQSNAAGTSAVALFWAQGTTNAVTPARVYSMSSLRATKMNPQ